MSAAAAISGKGLQDGKFRDLDREHPELEKYKKMLKMGLPQGAVENSMMRDGILPSSLFDSPINKPSMTPAPLEIPIMDIPPPPPLPDSSNASSRPPAVEKPPPGLSLIEEMKWKQANSKKRDVDANGNVVGSAGIKIPERKKSVMEPQRMVALKPAAIPSATMPNNSAPKVNPALMPKLNTVPKQPLPGPSATTKYTAPVYSSFLKPAPEKSSQTVKKETPTPKPASEPPKMEIEFMPLPQQLLLPQKPPEEARLEDGTRIVKDKDGGYTQYNPNGLVIREFADGSRKQTFPDGTIIEVNADGSKTVQTNPDGTRFESTQSGATTICFPDGTIIHEEKGEKRQTNPDGTIIHSFPDGKTIQTSIHNQIEITSYPDGSMDQLDKATGKKLHKRPDGVVEAVA